MTLRAYLVVLAVAVEAAFGQTQIDSGGPSSQVKGSGGGGGSSANFVITRVSNTDLTIAPSAAGFTNLACGYVTTRPSTLTIHLGQGAARTGAMAWPYWDCLSAGWIVATNAAMTQSAITVTNGTKGSPTASGLPIPDLNDDIIQTAALSAGTVADQWDASPIMDWEANQRAPFYVPGSNVTFTRNANGSTSINVSSGIVLVPANATVPCAAGVFAFDSSYAYFCVAANTWKRVAIGSW